jgi:hypothetical protein
MRSETSVAGCFRNRMQTIPDEVTLSFTFEALSVASLKVQQ